MTPRELHVVAVYSNPMQWRSRPANWQRFEAGMLAAGVDLTTVELEYGHRPFQLPERPGVRRIRVRGRDILWHKENLIRIGFDRLTGAGIDWRYGAAIDGDFLFWQDWDWARETISALQVHRVVQISSDLIFLGPHDDYTGHGVSFMRCFGDVRRRHYCGKHYHPGPPGRLDRHGYPGGAWAWTRDAYHAMGGPFDVFILGGGDQHMATGFVGMPDPVAGNRDYSPGYRLALANWRDRVATGLRYDIGLVPGTAFHLWHGKFADRQYSSRYQILVRNHYDPAIDIVRDHQGLIELAGNKPRLRDDVREYFSSRDEDSTVT